MFTVYLHSFLELSVPDRSLSL